MMTPDSLSKPSSGASTPNAAGSRFTAQAATAEDLLKSHTVGLVHLSDFRKRRAEALEQKEREAQDRSRGRVSTVGSRSGTATPATSEGTATPQPPRKKTKKRKAVTGKLSFGVNNDDDEETAESDGPKEDDVTTPGTETPQEPSSRRSSPAPLSTTTTSSSASKPKRLGPNTSLAAAPPRALTKSALLREAQTRESLRKEFLLRQEAVRATEVLIPFVFYDGTNIPGGRCRVKKGDPVWLFLDRARKVGAETDGREGRKREWARVGVDDLMVVRGEIIIPHHFDFYYFIVNQSRGPSGRPLFDFSAQPTTSATSDDRSDLNPTISTLRHPATEKSTRVPTEHEEDEDLEGQHDDPTLTKVVDRRWYERNKHIFPASVWEDFDAEKDYTKAIRRDTGGNAFFF